MLIALKALIKHWNKEWVVKKDFEPAVKDAIYDLLVEALLLAGPTMTLLRIIAGGHALSY